MLFPSPNIAWIIAQYERIQELNKGHQDALAEHRGNIIRALKDWAENQFCHSIMIFSYRSIGRTNIHSSQAPYWNRMSLMEKLRTRGSKRPSLSICCYAAVMILRFEPSYSKPTGLTFLELAKQLGSDRAVRMMTEGSGAYAKEDIHVKMNRWNAQPMMCSLITIVIRQEEASAYEQALAFIIRLLKKGFPKSYKIKLKSKAKPYLPIKGLAKSDTHRFFASALDYPNLHPLLEEYAREAIEEFEWYGDTEGRRTACQAAMPRLDWGSQTRRIFLWLNFIWGSGRRTPIGAGQIHCCLCRKAWYNS